MKKILLTGSTGFLGSYLTLKHLQKGNELYLIIRKKVISVEERVESTLNNIDPNWKNYPGKIHSIYVGDNTMPNLGLNEHELEEIRGNLDEIWHCSAMVSFSSFCEDDLFNVNFNGVHNLIALSEHIECKNLHYVSTAFVSGNHQGVFGENDIDKGQKFNNFYEDSKNQAEKFLTNYREKNKDFLITIYRPSIIVDFYLKRSLNFFIGLYGFIRAFHELKQYICQAELVKPINNTYIVNVAVQGDKNGFLNFVDTEFIGEFMLKVSENFDDLNKTYNVTNSNDTNIQDLFNQVTELFNMEGFHIQEEPVKNEDIINKVFTKCISNYVPYASFNTRFDRTNTDKVIAKYGIENCRNFDESIIRNIQQSLNLEVLCN